MRFWMQLEKIGLVEIIETLSCGTISLPRALVPLHPPALNQIICPS